MRLSTDKIRAITLASERETRSMKDSRFLREINPSPKQDSFFISDGDGSFPVLESAAVPSPDNCIQLRKVYVTIPMRSSPPEIPGRLPLGLRF